MNTIKIGVGIGDVKFGMERSDVKSIFGEPTEKDLFSYSEEEDDLSEVWHYDDYDFSLSFDEENDWQLIMIAGSDASQTIEGQEIIGLTVVEVQSALSKLGYQGEIEKEDESIEEGELVLKFAAQSMNIWFNDGVATEVQWGPMWEDEDTPIFPAK